jgi:reverse gyrase
MSDAVHPTDTTPGIPPPFDWSERGDYKWFSASGAQRLKEKVSSVIDFELDRFQVECATRILDGQDVLCINRTGAGKSVLIYAPVLAREGTISVVISPTNFLQQDMVRILKFPMFHASQIIFRWAA